jgi:hypothetical protein
MNSAICSYSRVFATLQLVLAPLLLLFSLGLIAAGVFGLYSRPEKLVVAVGGIAAGIWMSVIMWQWVRYRHSLRARYTLASRGVVVDSHGSTADLSWSDFDSAEYLIVPGMLRLKSKALDKPVFLFLDAGWGWDGAAERNRIARQLVAAHMGDRFRKTWAL